MTHGPMVGLVGTGIGVADSIATSLSVYGALGLATGAYAIGQGLAQKLGSHRWSTTVRSGPSSTPSDDEPPADEQPASNRHSTC